MSFVPLLAALAIAVGCGDDGSRDYGGSSGYDDGGLTAGSSGEDGGSVGTSSGGDSAGEDGGDDPPPDDEDPNGSGTGGDAECNDADDVTLFLSPDDSNSMSSPVQVREAVLDAWNSVSAVAIRPWEFFNYYTFDYPAADPGTVEVITELYRASDDPQGEYTLQIGVSSPRVDNDERAPLNVTLVLDTSGSMSGYPMQMLKEVCRDIAASLREGDEISMVTWSTTNAVLLGGFRVTGPSDATLMAKIEALSAGGGTDLNGGLTAGYELARQVYDPTRINRVVLISDGGANAGITDIDLIATNAEGEGQEGIYMVGVGVGDATTYHDELMDVVTDAGKGASVFIGDAVEARKVFRTDFVNTLAVSARDVQVRLDMPPGFEIVTFSGEEFSDDPAAIEPQHLAPNDAMVFHQQIATCAPELADAGAELTVTVRWLDAVTFEAREVSSTHSFADLLGGQSPLLHRGAAVFAYTEALRAVQDRAPAMDEMVDSALSVLERAEAHYPGDAELAEIREVLERL